MAEEEMAEEEMAEEEMAKMNARSFVVNTAVPREWPIPRELYANMVKAKEMHAEEMAAKETNAQFVNANMDEPTAAKVEDAETEITTTDKVGREDPAEEQSNSELKTVPATIQSQNEARAKAAAELITTRIGGEEAMLARLKLAVEAEMMPKLKARLEAEMMPKLQAQMEAHVARLMHQSNSNEPTVAEEDTDDDMVMV
jgi:hypothetical protein